MRVLIGVAWQVIAASIPDVLQSIFMAEFTLQMSFPYGWLAGLSMFVLATGAGAGPGTPGTPAAEVGGPQECQSSQTALGVSRIVEIDAASGPLFGAITKQAHEDRFLEAGEVVLTFDDGPAPWVTGPILDILDQFCAKATFFSVGRMALAYPSTLREVVVRGHTLGGHTFSHPSNLVHLSPESAVEEIERGMAALAAASGQPIAPFFRFPGLRDSDSLLGYLQARKIASFTVDVVSNDSFIPDPRELARRTLSQVDIHKGGIVLFHDIKPATVKALPIILKGLMSRGYKVVHLTSRRPLKVLSRYEGSFREKIANARKKQEPKSHTDPRRSALGMGDAHRAFSYAEDGRPLMVFQESIEALKHDRAFGTPPVSVLAPPARDRVGGWKYLPPPLPERTAQSSAQGTMVNAVSPSAVIGASRPQDANSNRAVLREKN